MAVHAFYRMGMSEQAQGGAHPKQGSPLMDLVFNLLIPVLILKKAGELLGLGPEVVLVIALSFPIGFGLKDFFIERKVNLFSVLGFINVLLTGVIGLFELSPDWVAVKEAAVPGVIGMLVVLSMWTPWPLVKTLLYSPRILQVDRIEQQLKERGTKVPFENTLAQATWLLAASFLLSSTLNYLLAKIMVKTHPSVDKVAFNDEISSMWVWSMVVIVIPSMVMMMIALWRIIHGIKVYAGLTLEQAMVGMETDSKPAASDA
jgi:hypothetical protein